MSAKTFATTELQGAKTRWQAECEDCGWHTRQAEGGDGMRWCNQMVHLHEQSCPAREAEA